VRRLSEGADGGVNARGCRRRGQRSRVPTVGIGKASGRTKTGWRWQKRSV